jgi:SAM-dependent methyltransferase
VPGADVRQTSGEALPWDADSFDVAAAQLVLNFMKDPDRGVEEMRRVVKPGGVVATCIWDTGGGMEMLRTFWEAAVALDPSAPAEGAQARFGGPEDLRTLFTEAGLEDLAIEPLDVEAAYEDFDDFWRPFTGGVGPAGSYCVSLTPAAQDALREECRRRLGNKSGPFRLGARSWAARGRKPA